jgi:hypothetical protein
METRTTATAAPQNAATTSNALAVASNPAVIVGHIDQAKTAYRLSKESAARAAAYCYLVWRDTLGPSAAAEAYDWLKAQVEQRNEAIKAHNEGEVFLRGRVKAFVANKLLEFNREDLALQESEDGHEMAAIIKERNRLKDLAKLTAKQWSLRQQVPILAREGASQFVLIVKFVLELHHPHESSVVSRYARVVEWIHANFKDKVINSPEEVVDAIQSAGGFDRTIEAQRGVSEKPVKVDDTIGASERKDMADFAIGKFKEALKAAKPHATIALAPKYTEDDIVVLIGRVNGSTIDVIDELSVEDKIQRAILATQNIDQVVPTQKASEFIGRVMELGKLITLDAPSEKTELDLKAGEPVKMERVISLVPHAKADFEVIVSARHADASVIIKAVPKLDAIGLGKIKSPVFLGADKTALLSKLVDKACDRRLFEFSREKDKSKVEWTARNIAIDPLKSTKSKRSFVWKDLKAEVQTPLDVVGFRPTIKAERSLNGILNECDRLQKKADEMSEKGKTEVIPIAFSGEKVTKVRGKGAEAQTTGAEKGQVTLGFRIHDLASLFLALAVQESESFTVSADSGGLLAASFEDELAQYTVYLPTVSADGKRLQNRRTEPMNFDRAADANQTDDETKGVVVAE